MYWSRYARYPKLLKETRADLYHFLDYGNGWLMKYLDSARTVFTCHDLIPLIFRDRRKSLFPWLSDLSYRQAVGGLIRSAAILANSDCTRRDLISHLDVPADKIHVVPLGIDPNFKPPASEEEKVRARAAFQLPDGKLLLHVGHTGFYKNIEGAIQCLRILVQQGKPVWLIRSGAYLQPRQQRLAWRLGISDRIVELGALSRDKLKDLYHAADLLLQPSWYEGMGLPPLEAMASGVPVVVSNRGALPETVGDAGLIVDPEKPENLADAVQKLLHDPSLQAELRARGLTRASQFRWETTAQKTWEVYQSVLKGCGILLT